MAKLSILGLLVLALSSTPSFGAPAPRPLPQSSGSPVDPTKPPGPGCEFHIDHWHCPPGATPPPGSRPPRDGCVWDPPTRGWKCPRRTTTSVTATATATATTTSAAATPTPTKAPIDPTKPPRPGCEFHIDHWHCPPIRSSTTSASTAPTKTPIDPTKPPRPGCEFHIDHWHCPPETTATATTTSTATTTKSAEPVTPTTEPGYSYGKRPISPPKQDETDNYGKLPAASEHEHEHEHEQHKQTDYSHGNETTEPKSPVKGNKKKCVPGHKHGDHGAQPNHPAQPAQPARPAQPGRPAQPQPQPAPAPAPAPPTRPAPPMPQPCTNPWLHGDHWHCDEDNVLKRRNVTPVNDSGCIIYKGEELCPPEPGCHWHDDHWDCHGDHHDHKKVKRSTLTKRDETEPGHSDDGCVIFNGEELCPPEPGCHWHDDHWDCHGDHDHEH